MNKLNNLIVIAITLAAAASSTYAANINDTYTPPKQLICTIKNRVLSCDGLNNLYIKGGTFNGTIQENIPFTVTFQNAQAYTSFKNFILFYEYRTADNKLIQLNKTYAQINPDLKSSSWIPNPSNTMYSCKTNCSITNLPL